MNDLDQFLKQYEETTNSHDFDNVTPLIAKNAVYWFKGWQIVHEHLSSRP